ncbi:MAG: hypothetical protein ACRDRI_26070 [Pseudonocardiaceae bacterium]
MRYAAEKLEQMPTLFIGFADDLKIETDTIRVWLARTTEEDGQPCNNKVTIEELQDGCWVDIEEYQG